MSQPKTHTGEVVTKDGNKRIKLRETATTGAPVPERHTTNSLAAALEHRSQSVV